jgi:hypothetical protein
VNKAFDTQVGGDHYKDMKIQPTEFIEANELSFLEGCVVKRICRWRRKNGIEDLEKAKHEIDMLIELAGPEIQPVPDEYTGEKVRYAYEGEKKRCTI